jgi:hypothetical protein
MTGFVKVFGCRPLTDVPRARVAGVGKPPKEETAGREGGRFVTRDPIPYALETDWPVGAAGFEPLHIRIGICQDSQPGGRDSNLRISN